MQFNRFKSSPSESAEFPESELVLNKDNSVYHLHLLPEHIADTIIAVGDPGRVYRVSMLFDEVEFEMNKREFITHTGYYKGKRMTVISTGIGTDNVEILLTELDALVNINLKTRRRKSRHTRLKIVRVGTSGSLQSDIKLGSHLASHSGIGLDSLMCFYPLPQTPEELRLGTELQQLMGLPFVPYHVSASQELLDKVAFDMEPGNTVTCPGFYAPQGRHLRIAPKVEGLVEKLSGFRMENSAFRITNFEMETAGYYALGRLLGHDVLSVNALIANRITNKFHASSNKVIDALIKKVLDRLAS